MKKIYTMAFAALLALVSCQKETIEPVTTDGVRVLTGELEENMTKTILGENGTKPKWAIGDVIRIMSSGAYQDVTLKSGSDTPIEAGDGIINEQGRIVVAIPSSMEGTLYAVYPASATGMTSCSNGTLSLNIPSMQDGTFASANICVAKGDDKDNFQFNNACAVVEIAVSDNVIGSEITADNAIAGTISVSYSDGYGINSVVTTGAADKSIISIKSTTPTDKKFYLAVAPTTPGTVRISCHKIDTKATAKVTSLGSFAKNTIYGIDLSGLAKYSDNDLTGMKGTQNGHEFVLVKTGNKYLKWATVNMGASSKDNPGWYIAWAAAEIAYSAFDGTTFTFMKSRPASYSDDDANHKGYWLSGSTNGFYDASAPYFYPGGYYKYTQTNVTLEAKDDIAAVQWGGGWRIPTPDEFKGLCSSCYIVEDGKRGITIYKAKQGDEGYLKHSTYHYKFNGEQYNNQTHTPGIYNDSDICIFLPGGGNAGNLSANIGYYWTDRISKTNKNPYYFQTYTYVSASIPSAPVIKDNLSRATGMNVRAVCD